MAQSYHGMKHKLKTDDYKAGPVKVYTEAELKAYNKKLAKESKSDS